MRLDIIYTKNELKGRAMVDRVGNAAVDFAHYTAEKCGSMRSVVTKIQLDVEEISLLGQCLDPRRAPDPCTGRRAALGEHHALQLSRPCHGKFGMSPSRSSVGIDLGNCPLLCTNRHKSA